MKTKKELKNQYKQKKHRMGVFKILNLSNHKILIDASTNVDAKWNRHVSELSFNSHANRQLQKDWNESGKENFELRMLSELKPKTEENVNYAQDLKLLKEMVSEELKLDEAGFY